MLNKRKLKVLSMSTILGLALTGGMATNAYATVSNNAVMTNRTGVLSNVKESTVVKNKQEFYDALKSALEKFETNVSIKVMNYNSRDYDLSIANKIILEHPSINYGYAGIGGNIYGYPNSPEKTLNLTIRYRLDKDTMKKQRKAVKEKVQNIIQTVIKPGMTEVQKELALHDYIVKNADYNVTNYRSGIVTAEDHNAYGILVKNTGVCESYAKAMYELLKAAGIKCKYVTGYTNQGGGHAWNMVKLDNQWYNLDVTWDDPVSDRNLSGNQNMIPVSHKYFNVPDNIFNRDHRRGNLEQSFPACTATKYSFENLNIDEYTGDGKLFTKVQNVQQLDSEILKALTSHQDTLCIKLKGLNINLNQLMNRMQIIARNNRIYGFGMRASMSDSYIRVNLSWQ
ncbi:transglutaminase [Clostridium botulinum]|uniref:Transglutaminase n=1 Tax=Clostridium botulinum C/D str. DC5 TaxID=1443128 RepID=A0A0A0IK88_CLOBO|nr:transglutaminase domain-containing protein [Clostridium botulinum]KEI03217.1 transglutaminase [Clostridium botulinum C/D str. BKT75002]KEI07593.1 transglutaminase [Clostridium botulinum C/D str. BKT2873]KGM99975.1 transglutaminase [Clostridium botulinum C/D str. DC5]KOC56067.1 transglutaminase [Clostridium botulinum]KOC57725.1 transglutaminase [Clostridium botulinum]